MGISSVYPPHPASHKWRFSLGFQVPKKWQKCHKRRVDLSTSNQPLVESLDCQMGIRPAGTSLHVGDNDLGFMGKHQRKGVTFSSWCFFTNPFKKYAQVKMGSSFPSFGVKIKHVWNHHPVFFGGGEMIGEIILVCGFFTTHLKNIHQIGSFPQIFGVKMQNVFFQTTT